MASSDLEFYIKFTNSKLLNYLNKFITFVPTPKGEINLPWLFSSVQFSSFQLLSRVRLFVTP